MVGRIITRLGPALALAAVASAAAAGGAGYGGVRMPAGGGMRFGAPSFHGVQGAVSRWTARGLPPISGVIHERPGARSFVSGYRHTDTAGRRGGFAGGARYGHTATAWRRAGRFAYGTRGFLGYGAGGFAGYGAGLYGYGYGYGGGVGAPGAGAYAAGSADPGSYGSVTTQASPYGGAYASEVPLAATFAEPPLAPSPGAPFDPRDAYAYAASADSGPGPRIIQVGRRERSDCRCGAGERAEPVVYRYGVGTAY